MLNLLEGCKNADYSGKTANEWVYRLSASQSFAIAVSLVTGSYDADYTGVPEDQAKEMAIKLLSSVAYANIANGGHYQQWGDDWQANLWAYFTGISAWYLWDDLNEEQQTLVTNMMVNQANRLLNTEPPYWISEDNIEMYPGDSKIEENAWNAELMYLASQMMPEHENAKKWYAKFIEYQLASFATPEMNSSDEIVHGRKAKDWVSGYNINSDGTVVNHGIVHPTYNATSDGVNLSIVGTPAGQKLPLAAKYNLDKLYSAFTQVTFTEGEIPINSDYPVQSPGGVIYKPYTDDKNCSEDGPDSIAFYPHGSDWGKDIYDVFANIDVSAYVYGYGDKEEAYNYAKYHTKQVLYQQDRNENGSTYISDKENNYLGREEAISTRMGLSYMTLWLNEQAPVQFENNPVPYFEENLR